MERLFGAGVISFMEKKDYDLEANYVRVVHNWRRAIDERGLTTEQRHQYRKELLNFILDDLMPWHSTEGLNDFSLLEVNRCVVLYKLCKLEAIIFIVHSCSTLCIVCNFLDFFKLCYVHVLKIQGCDSSAGLHQGDLSCSDR